MLTLACGDGGVPPPDGCDLLVFKDKELTHQYDDLGPCAALIDGASCVVNHAELIWPPFSRLCQQLRSRLLHVYINSYVTPAESQAVSAHADDRDVFILQLRGRKRWKVYEEPPIKYPYPHEQVGKQGLKVPEKILERPVIEHELQPGDVLYMPRGYVHEASCSSYASWHATLAIATHDWSWTKVLTQMAAKAMDTEASGRWRQAVPLNSLAEGAPKNLDSIARSTDAELEQVLDYLRQNLSLQSLSEAMANKLRAHNMNQSGYSMEFQELLKERSVDEACPCPYFKLRCIRSSTRVRKATKDEKENDRSRAKSSRGRRGLLVRDELANAVNAVLADLGRRADAGRLVSELNGTCDDTESSALFDELSKLCMARLCIRNGAFRVVSNGNCDRRML